MMDMEGVDHPAHRLPIQHRNHIALVVLSGYIWTEVKRRLMLERGSHWLDMEHVPSEGGVCVNG